MPIQAARFALLEMARWSRHARSAGPNRSWLSSQCSSRGEDRAKQPRARMMKIVVGSRGTNAPRSEEHTSELQSLMRISYAVFCLKKKRNKNKHNTTSEHHKSYTLLLT